MTKHREHGRATAVSRRKRKARAKEQHKDRRRMKKS